MNEIGTHLRQIREANQMTQAEVLERMSSVKGGIRNRVSLSQIESGKYRPTHRKLAALTRGYRLSPKQSAELEVMLLNGEKEHRLNQSRGISRPSLTRSVNEAEVINLLLKLSAEARERVIRTIKAFDAS
ncbi:helix-turn-helix domain-containing protein [Candidatus Kaiserbacteria bacterium]|nr:helix-turn-helix domain-containing protein [Candidatus Kaiserbacteria bacterium]